MGFYKEQKLELLSQGARTDSGGETETKRKKKMQELKEKGKRQKGKIANRLVQREYTAPLTDSIILAELRTIAAATSVSRHCGRMD